MGKEIRVEIDRYNRAGKNLYQFENADGLQDGQVVIAYESTNEWKGVVRCVNDISETGNWFIELLRSTWVDTTFPAVPKFSYMDQKHAIEHFNWFVVELKNEHASLEKLYKKTGGEGMLNYSPHSLKGLWTWLLAIKDKNFEIHGRRFQERESSEIEEVFIVQNRPNWIKEMVGKPESPINGGLLETILKVGIYLGNICCYELVDVKWAISNGSEKYKPIVTDNSMLFLNPVKKVYDLLFNKVSNNGDFLYSYFNVLKQLHIESNKVENKYCTVCGNINSTTSSVCDTCNEEIKQSLLREAILVRK